MLFSSLQRMRLKMSVNYSTPAPRLTFYVFRFIFRFFNPIIKIIFRYFKKLSLKCREQLTFYVCNVEFVLFLTQHWKYMKVNFCFTLPQIVVTFLVMAHRPDQPIRTKEQLSVIFARVGSFSWLFFPAKFSGVLVSLPGKQNDRSIP